ncbi:hypothetical protein APHAL10511_000221 [Amanita phalloides]|nr:hypothetical protein APHAL10511_000221 [Amanita phalloides]
MSLHKLTSLSTQTLSLLLERQRLQSFAPPPLSSDSPAPSASTHLSRIVENLAQLRAGILELEAKEGPEAALQLRSQFERMRSMVGDEARVESLDVERGEPLTSMPGPSLPVAGAMSHKSLTNSSKEFALSAAYTPYTDDPEEETDSNAMMQAQKHMMNEQDAHLDRLSHSINRQHHISLQINDELDVHAGLLEDLDTSLDGTDTRLRGARRRLDKFAKGARENSSAVMIVVLILVLLILIIVFKT